MKDQSYSVQFAKKAQKGYDSLPERKRKVIDSFVDGHLRLAPLNRRPGKVKRLQGGFRELLQFRVDDQYRLLYRVDTAAHTVFVEYVGPHPNW